MAYFSWDDLNAYSAGGLAYDFLKGVSNGARDFACSLYKNYQGFWLTRQLPSNPVSDFLSGAWDSACSYSGSPGLPPALVSPFTGGQCLGHSYYVYFRRPDGVVTNTNGRGPIYGIGIFDWGSGRQWQIVAAGNGPYGAFVLRPDGRWYQAVGNENDGIYQITSVTPEDGLPDTCGNPKPFVDPTPPPDSECRRTIPVPRPPDRPPGPPIQIPLVYVPITNNFVVDVGGITIKVDVGGITIKLPEDAQPNVDLDPVLDRLAQLEAELEILSEMLENIADKLPRPTTPPEPGNPDYDFDPPLPPGDNNEENIENLAWVLLDLVSYPSNAKTQYGAGAPNLIYGGWFEFKVGTRCLPREPVHFGSNVFKAPEGVDGYSYTLYNGFLGQAQTIKRKEA